MGFLVSHPNFLETALSAPDRRVGIVRRYSKVRNNFAIRVSLHPPTNPPVYYDGYIGTEAACEKFLLLAVKKTHETKQVGHPPQQPEEDAT